MVEEFEAEDGTPLFLVHDLGRRSRPVAAVASKEGLWLYTLPSTLPQMVPLALLAAVVFLIVPRAWWDLAPLARGSWLPVVLRLMYFLGLFAFAATFGAIRQSLFREGVEDFQEKFLAQRAALAYPHDHFLWSDISVGRRILGGLWIRTAAGRKIKLRGSRASRDFLVGCFMSQGVPRDTRHVPRWQSGKTPAAILGALFAGLVVLAVVLPGQAGSVDRDSADEEAFDTGAGVRELMDIMRSEPAYFTSLPSLTDVYYSYPEHDASAPEALANLSTAAFTLQARLIALDVPAPVYVLHLGMHGMVTHSHEAAKHFVHGIESGDEESMAAGDLEYARMCASMTTVTDGWNELIDWADDVDDEPARAIFIEGRNQWTGTTFGYCDGGGG